MSGERDNVGVVLGKQVCLQYEKALGLAILMGIIMTFVVQ